MKEGKGIFSDQCEGRKISFILQIYKKTILINLIF
jgi:hypothetical protein